MAAALTQEESGARESIAQHAALILLTEQDALLGRQLRLQDQWAEHVRTFDLWLQRTVRPLTLPLLAGIRAGGST